jgi:hypothetical protein
VLRRIVFGKPFKTLHEANAFMDELRSELIQLPFSSRVDPDSPASLIARAQMDADDEAAESHLVRAANLARQQLPPDFFDQPADPDELLGAAAEWFEAKMQLAERARLDGEHEDSVRHYEEIHRLMPAGDVRESLLAAYLAVGNTEAAKPLLNGLDDGTMKWFAGALYEHLCGDLRAATSALLRAFDANRFLHDYLTAERQMPAKPSFSQKAGSRGEANLCMFRLIPAWAAHPSAVEWLQGEVG